MRGIWPYVGQFIMVYSYAIFAYIIMSWFVSNASGPLRELYRGLTVICEPFLSLFRRVLPPIMLGSGGLDLSPMIALIVLQLLARVIGNL
jgi:YggT family protein